MPNENAQDLLLMEEDKDELYFEQAEELLSQQLEDAIADLELSEEEKNNIGNPDSLGKVIKEEIWKQFANQIGLDITDETLIQEYNRKHPETYEEVSKKVLQDKKYTDSAKAMKDKHKAGNLKDTYTGKNLGKDDNPNLDHTVSRKEIFENDRRKQAGIPTEDLANKTENLNPTNEALNKSKGAKSVDEYTAQRKQREADLRKQNEAKKKKIDESNMMDAQKKAAKEKADKALQDKLDADDKLMLDADKKARKAINKDIRNKAVKNTAKKAAKDALKAMAVSALMDLLKEVMNGFVRFIKSKAKSFKDFLSEMKTAIKNFMSKITSFVKQGAKTVVSTIVTEILDPIIGMFKKFASLIKQGVSSFVDAIKFLTDKNNKSLPFSQKVAQVGKIVVAGLTGVGALFLGEIIEKVLLRIPVMAIKIPLLGTLANVIGIFLASLVCGIIGAIVINLIDKFLAKKMRAEVSCVIVEKNDAILSTQNELINLAKDHAEYTKTKTATDIMNRHAEANAVFEEAANEIANKECEEKINDILNDSNDDAFAAMQAALSDLL